MKVTKTTTGITGFGLGCQPHFLGKTDAILQLGHEFDSKGNEGINTLGFVIHLSYGDFHPCHQRHPSRTMNVLVFGHS